MNSKWFIFAALWIASLAAAYFVGSGSSEPAATPGAYGASSSSAASSRSSVGSSYAVDEEGFGLTAEELAAQEAAGKKGSSAFQQLARGNIRPETWMQARIDLLSYNSSQLGDALETVMALPSGRDRNFLVYELLNRWGQVDPQSAIAYAQNISSLDLRSRGVGQVLEGWGKSDPVSAINWLNENGDAFSTRTYGNYLENVIEGYAESNPGSAFQYVSALPEDTVADRRIKEGALREVVEAMVEQNQIDQALSMTLALGDSSARNSALSRLVDEWADRDPEAARSFVDSMAEDPSYSDLQRSLLRSWSNDDPAAAAAWLSSLDPETTNQAQLATQLVAEWTRYDMAAAAEWLNSLPQTSDLDRAVGMYSMRAAQDDPAAALTWANSVSNDESRQRLESMILPMLREQDNEAFEAYLADSDYSDDKKQQLRELQVREGRGGWGRGNWGGGPGR